METVRSVTIGQLTGLLERIDELRSSAAGGGAPDRGRGGTAQSSTGPARPAATTNGSVLVITSAAVRSEPDHAAREAGRTRP